MESQPEAGMLNVTGASGSGLLQARREKTWDESDNEQRMQKMRDEVRYLRREITAMQSDMRKLKAHQHSLDGSLLVPIKTCDVDERPRGYVYDPLK